MGVGQPPGIKGFVRPQFEQVAEEFRRNFTERGEVGASVCVYADGEPVVDLWGGSTGRADGTDWGADTTAVAWSCTKGATALCANMLADRGELDLDAPVARYWPEFAANGKTSVTGRMLLNHQAGLPAWRERLRPGDLYDWELATSLLAAQQPYWEPGTRHGYHSVTFGFLVGEVVRRVSGCTLGAFFQAEVAEPLGIGFWIGLPEERESEVADSELFDAGVAAGPLYQTARDDPGSIGAQVFTNSAGLFEPGAVNTHPFHAAQIPSVNGITHARGLAGMYRVLSVGGTADGHRLVSWETLRAMGRIESASSSDAVFGVPTYFGLGFRMSQDNRTRGKNLSLILGEDAFGHHGWGGSIGFADPHFRLAFGYVMNRHGPGTINERGQSLIDAAYRSLGATTDAPGFWLRVPAMLQEDRH